MCGFVVRDGTCVAVVGFLQGPVQSAVGVAHGHGAEVAGQEDERAAIVVDGECAVFVQVNACAEGQAIVGFAGHAEQNVDVGEELGFDAHAHGVVAAEQTHFSPTGDCNFCGSDTSGGDKRGRCEENLFHGFSLVR